MDGRSNCYPISLNNPTEILRAKCISNATLPTGRRLSWQTGNACVHRTSPRSYRGKQTTIRRSICYSLPSHERALCLLLFFSAPRAASALPRQQQQTPASQPRKSRRHGDPAAGEEATGERKQGRPRQRHGRWRVRRRGRQPVGGGGAAGAVAHGGADHSAQLRGVPARHGFRALPGPPRPARPRRRRARHRAHQHHGPQRALRPRVRARAALRPGLRLPQLRHADALPPPRRAAARHHRRSHRAALAQRRPHPRRAGPGPGHLRLRRRIRRVGAPGPRRAGRAAAAPRLPSVPGHHKAHGRLLRGRRRAACPAQPAPRLQNGLRSARRGRRAGAHQHQHGALPARLRAVGGRVRGHVEGLRAPGRRRQRARRPRPTRRAQLHRRVPRVVVVRGRHRARRLPPEPHRRRGRGRSPHPDHQPDVHRAHGARRMRLHPGGQRAGRREAAAGADGVDGGTVVRGGRGPGARGVDGGVQRAVGVALHAGANGVAAGVGGDAGARAVRAGQLPADHWLRRAARHGQARRGRPHQSALLLPRRHARGGAAGVWARAAGRVRRAVVRAAVRTGGLRGPGAGRRRVAHRLARRGHARAEADRHRRRDDGDRHGGRRGRDEAPRGRQRPGGRRRRVATRSFRSNHLGS